MSIVTCRTRHTRSVRLRQLGRPMLGIISLLTASAVVVPSGPASAAKGRSDFSILATADQQLVDAGGTVTFDFALRRTGGFRGTVAWAVRGLPAGATSTIVTKRKDSFKLSVVTPANAPTAESTFVLSGRSGSKLRSRLLRLTVVAKAPGVTGAAAVTTVVPPAASVAPTVAPVTTAPGVTVAPTAPVSTPTSTAVGPKFELLIGTSPVTMFAGDTTSYNVSLDRSSGYQGPVIFSVSGAPPGSATLFDPPETTGPRTKLSVIAAAGAPPSTSTLTIMATAGSTTKVVTTRLVIWRHPPNGNVVIRPFDADVVPGETFNVTVDAVGDPVEGGRIRVQTVYLRGAAQERVLGDVQFMEVGNSLTFNITAGNDLLQESLFVNSSRNSPNIPVTVRPFTMRAPTKSFQVDRGKTVPIRFDIRVAPGIDPAQAMTLARSPLNANLPVPTYQFRLGTGGNWIAELTPTRTAPLGKTIEYFTLFTTIGTKIESVRVPIEIEVIDSSGTIKL